MIVRVKRLRDDGDTTIGKMYIDSIYQCYTLEDQKNTKKVYGETRIPAGTYEIKLRKTGTTNEDYLKRFGPNFHKGTLWLQDVPGFQFILIHIGNTDEDTAGCILTGESLGGGGWTLVNSTVAYKKIYPQISDKLLNNEKVFITVEDEG